jgi:hypothetical protein
MARLRKWALCACSPAGGCFAPLAPLDKSRQNPAALLFLGHQHLVLLLLLLLLLLLQVRLYPHDTSSWLLSDDGAAVLAAALQGQHLAPPSAASDGGAPASTGGAPPAALQQHLLAALRAAADAAPQLQRASGEVQQLLAVLRGLQEGGAPEGGAEVQAEAAAVAEQLARLCC